MFLARDDSPDNIELELRVPSVPVSPRKGLQLRKQAHRLIVPLRLDASENAADDDDAKRPPAESSEERRPRLCGGDRRVQEHRRGRTRLAQLRP